MQLTQEANGFKYTTAIRKLRKLKKRIKKIPGGTSAGKTYGILPVLIQRATKTPLLEISVVSESLPHLRKGAMKDFLKIMKATGRYIDANWSRTLLTYSFSNGSYIEFFSADQEDKVRGPRRNILYINECNNLKFETYHQLAIRTDMEIWLDYNPTHEFWANTELKDDEDVEELILTYKDNEGLADSIIREIEKALKKAFIYPDRPIETLFNDDNIKSQYWSNWWRVYGLGLTGSLEGVIFGNWSQVPQVPKEAQLLGYGMDFGFTNDPTALVAVYRIDGRIVLDELIYKTGLLNSDIIREMKVLGIDPRSVIYADSAEPKTIEEIRRSGFNIQPTVKGADSITFGITILQEQNLLVTSQSVNLIKELRNYTWDKDKTGAKLNKPIDDWNHCFIGSTKINTYYGLKNISDISENDLVQTSNGFKRVLKKWNNGIKQVSEYSMQLGIFSLSLTSTKDHKIKTLQGWKKISELQKGQKIFLHKSSMGKLITYTLMKGISQKVEKGFTGLFGKSLTEKFLKDIMFTTLTKILTIIGLKTSLWYLSLCTYVFQAKEDLKTIQNGQKTFIQKELKKLKTGIDLKKGESGMLNMVKNVGLIGKSLIMSARFAVKNISRLLKKQNTATLIVKLRHLEEGEESSQEVFDLMIDQKHEYFANGVLVHNCIDATRYFAMMALKKRSESFVLVNGKIIR